MKILALLFGLSSYNVSYQDHNFTGTAVILKSTRTNSALGTCDHVLHQGKMLLYCNFNCETDAECADAERAQGAIQHLSELFWNL